MKKFFSSNFYVPLIFIFLSFALFWQFFIKGLIPYPGNFMLAWYEPWKTDHFVNNVITLPHKAIAEDTFRQIYPFRALGMDQLKNFQPPLWNPYNGAGMPLLAAINIGYLDPFNILYFIFPGFLAWGIYIVIQPILIGSFTYLYCKKISLNTLASIFAGFVFALSGSVVTRYIYEDYGLAYSLIPLLLYIFESFAENIKSKIIYLLPIVVFSLLVSSQPQISLYIITFTSIYFIYRLYPFNSNKLKNSFLPILLFLLGIGLAAVQLFPTLELFKQANMNSDSSSFIFNIFLLSPLDLISIFIPNYFGNPSTYNFWGKMDFIQTAMYLGLIPTFFAFIALINRDKKSSFIKFYFCVAIISTLLSLDWFLSKAIYSLSIPLVSTGIPARILILTTFSLTVLSACGFQILLDSKNFFNKHLKQIITISLLPTLVILITFLFYKMNLKCPDPIYNCRMVALRNTSIEIFVFIALLMLVYLYSRYKNLKQSILFPVLIILVFLILGSYNAYKFTPFSPKESFKPNNSLINKIKEISQTNRVFGLGKANINTNFATFFRFYDAEYYHPLYIRRFGEFVNFANNKNTKSLARSDVEIIKDLNLDEETKNRRERLFDVLGIKYLIFSKEEAQKANVNLNNIIWEDKNWIITERKTYLPKLHITQNYKVITEKNVILDTIYNPDFDPYQTVILEEDPNLILSNSNRSTLKMQYYNENSLQAFVKTVSPQILLLNDNFYPGWKAYVDGKETKIYRANYSFRAVELPKGNYEIKFVYEPFSFKLGLTISLLSLIIYLSFIICKEINFLKQLIRK